MYKNHQLVLKVDCEGCEYAVIKNLLENKMLAPFHTIMIEWHLKGSDDIVDMLEKEHFTVFDFPHAHSQVFGMLYAVNTRST